MRRLSSIILCAFLLSLVPVGASAQFGDLKRGLDKLKAAAKAAKTTTAEKKSPAGPSASRTSTGGPQFDDGALMLWVAREYTSWDNPLHSELAINGKTVNIFSSDTFEPVGNYIQDGWNTITLRTYVQEPANNDNGLLFRIGPAYHDEDSRGFVMNPVLWEFRNDTDWELRDDGTYFHPLGPSVKEVTLTWKTYWAGLENEMREIGAGDFILQGRSIYDGWNSPVTATVFVNGTPLNTFILGSRGIVITPFLKTGKNDIRIVSARVDNAISENDVKFAIAGPAEWIVDRGEYEVKPLIQFNAMQGWTQDRKSGRLVNRADAKADTIERTITFLIKDEEAE
ncbi:MAG: hypothetical protein ACRD2J_04930 [Thermoanaerobaculia bacterium]